MHQRGFTLSEVMIVVALISVLVAIAIPVFSQTAKKAKGASEVAPLFNDIRVRMDQFFQENGIYPATIGEGTLWPDAPTSTRQNLLPVPDEWTAIKIRPSGPTEVYCGYTWVTGLASDNANRGPVAAAAPFNFTAPATSWYYLLARCNFDGDNAVDSYYLSSSVDPTIQKLNEGR
jgi:prepilin-type N-terminal cleavage/methylation domain-containing protein